MFAARLIEGENIFYLRNGTGGITLSGPGTKDDGEDGLRYWAQCALFNSLTDVANAIVEIARAQFYEGAGIERVEVLTVDTVERIVTSFTVAVA